MKRCVVTVDLPATTPLPLPPGARIVSMQIVDSSVDPRVSEDNLGIFDLVESLAFPVAE